MRYCNQCHRITAGEPLFCNFCGSSYTVKLCPSRHVNPRNAEVCSTCGSRDLSTPAPRLPFWLAPLLYLLSLFPAVILVLLSLLVVAGFVNVILTDQQVQFQLVLAVMLLALLWWLWMHLPPFVRSLFRTLWHKSRKDRRNR